MGMHTAITTIMEGSQAGAWEPEKEKIRGDIATTEGVVTTGDRVFTLSLHL